MSVLRGTREGPITEVSCFCYIYFKCCSYRCHRENIKALSYHLKNVWFENIFKFGN